MKRSSKIQGALLATICLAVALTAARWARAAGAAETVRRLEQAQVRAAVAGDKRALERIFAPDFVLVSPAGTLSTRAQLLALLTGGAAPYRRATYDTQLLRNLGRVIVTVGLESVVPNQGAQAGKTVHRRVTQVWKRAGDTWQLTLRQAMVMP